MRMIMAKNEVCKKCNNLVNGWCEKVIKYTCGAGTPEEAETNCTYFIRGECTSSFCEYRRKKQTNADRIRQMSDFELAKEIENAQSGIEIKNPKNIDYFDCILEWIRQPAE